MLKYILVLCLTMFSIISWNIVSSKLTSNQQLLFESKKQVCIQFEKNNKQDCNKATGNALKELCLRNKLCIEQKFEPEVNLKELGYGLLLQCSKVNIPWAIGILTVMSLIQMIF